MQVTILGSTGQVGKAVINQALKAKLVESQDPLIKVSHLVQPFLLCRVYVLKAGGYERNTYRTI